MFLKGSNGSKLKTVSAADVAGLVSLTALALALASPRKP